jgi:ribA/ribD-fused uncharacterized protein
MSEAKKERKKRKKSGRHTSGPSPSTVSRPPKDIKLYDVDEERWAQLDSRSQDSELDAEPIPPMDLLEEDPEDEIEMMLDRAEAEERAGGDMENVMDCDAILATLKENSSRMGEAAPWACGLMGIVEQLVRKVKSLEKSLEYSQAKEVTRKEEQDDIKDDVSNLTYSFTGIQQVIGAHETSIDTLQEKSIKLDTVQRSKNLLFRGIGEDGRNTMEDCLRKIDNVLERRLEMEPSVVKINRCHRVGPTPDRASIRSGRATPRPILVEFQWNFNREQVLEKAKWLYGTGITVDEDYPVEVIQRRATLTPIVKRAQRTRGFHDTKLIGDRLLSKGRMYTVESAVNLPEAINPLTEATKTDGNSTIFYSRYSKLSNHNPASFVVDDVTFRSSEQFYFSERCRMMGDEEQQCKVMASKDPKDCQRLGRQAINRTNVRWEDHDEEVMTRACWEKFSKNMPAQRALLKTASTTLGESSKSRHWGTGFYATHPRAFHTEYWENNLLGRVLTTVRERLQSLT